MTARPVPSSQMAFSAPPPQSMREAAWAYLRSPITSSQLIPKNALFLAERLVAEPAPADEDWLLLAQCRERVGAYRSGLSALRRIQTPTDASSYLEAWLLYKAGDEGEAKRVLFAGSSLAEMRATVVASGGASCGVPGGAPGVLLLAKLVEASAVVTLSSSPVADAREIATRPEDWPLAASLYELAVELDPFLFEARERLSALLARVQDSRAHKSTLQHQQQEQLEQLVLPNRPVSSHSSIRLLESLELANGLLCRYRCDEASAVLSRLARGQLDTGYVLHQLARAKFEMGKYEEAVAYFERMRVVDPYRVEGLELYSTALWQLKKEVDLAHLARFAAEHAAHASQTWIVVGNFFSLQKDQDLALRFFRRALQLDPTCAYGHTLAGHEYVANESFEKATACYRSALRHDESFYRAWWGLGTIYFRQERFALAELHFARALRIHPNFGVLWCFMSMVQQAQGRHQEALQSLATADALDPLGPQARFQRAQILQSLNRLEEAYEELGRVQDAAPKEVTVHLMMGRLAKLLGMQETATSHFIGALDLEPKDAATVRAAIEQLDDQSQRAIRAERDYQSAIRPRHSPGSRIVHLDDSAAFDDDQ